MPTDIVFDAGKLTHDNYSTSTVAATRSLPSRTSAILIANTDATNNVLVSFDGGNTFFTIKPGVSLSLDLKFESSYQVKSSASTPAVQALYASEA